MGFFSAFQTIFDWINIRPIKTKFLVAWISVFYITNDVISTSSTRDLSCFVNQDVTAITVVFRAL